MKCFRILLLMISGTIAKENRPRKANTPKQVPENATEQLQSKRDWIYGQNPLAGPVPVYVPPVTRWNSEFVRQEKGNNRGFVAPREAKPAVRSVSLAAVNSSNDKGTLFKSSVKTTQTKETKKPALSAIIYSTKGESHDAKVNNAHAQKKSSTAKQGQTRYQSTKASDESSAGNGGGGLGSILKGANVQGAVVEKGIEVMGKLVDKQLQIIDEAQEKAENFLKKEIKLDIVPDKSWQTDDMFVPAGYHMNSQISSEDSAPKEVGEPPYTYPAGVGNVLMNGCWGTGYQEGDPCYAARWKLEACLNLIDGAAFMGVGFDGRGEYSPESRKMSIVQRNCAGKATYDDYDVPDTMNVHGIYDTKASMVTFESRSEFQKYLQEEAGVSGSYFGFYAGVKAGWGESETQASQKYMALLHVDINRYEIFIDEVKPKDLSASFLKEFMALPTSYFAADAPLRYLDFIQRWGTHYIKSGKFGGQLQIRKYMDASDVSSKKEFAREMEMEYKSLFASVGAKESRREGESSRKQAKTTSTSILAMGGSQEIASILSDAYSPTFKNEFKDWLASIPQYPKPFQFQMAPVTNLLNFRLHDLFPEERSNWGCEGNAAKLQEEVTANEDKLKFYETVDSNGTTHKHYCQFDSRKSLEEAITRRRISLTRAIEVYMKEGPNSITDIQLPPCNKDTPTEPEEAAPGTTTQADEAVKYSNVGGLSWQHITNAKATFRVIFDMRNDLKGTKDFSDISRNMSRLVRYKQGEWFTAEKDGSFHLYNAFKNGKSGDPRQHKISILGLVLSFNQNTGGLTLLSRDLEASREFFPDLHDALVGRELGRAVLDSSTTTSGALKRETLTDPPCNVRWSNALRFDPTETKGKCLHFTASSEGNIFVVFATLPVDKTSWYYIEITPQKVSIYKGFQLKTSTANINARGLGEPSLLQSYFVCVTETDSSTLIEYGKTLGTTQSGDVYLNMLDLDKPLNARFYAFGNGDKKADVIDAHIVARDQTKAECKGDTYMDLTTKLCTQYCHEDCDPLYGCNTESSGNPLPTECNACRVAQDKITGSCLPECPPEKYLTADKLCVDLSSTYDMEFFYVDASSYKRVTVREVPELQALTLCFWIRLPQGYSKKTAFAYPAIIDYTSGSNELEKLTLLLREDSDTKEIKLDLVFEGGGEQLPLGVLSDQNWHQICITWVGHSGVTIQYVDGVRKMADTRHIATLEGGGTLSVGHHTDYTYQITGVNLWDKVIPPEEIAGFSKACEKGNGNVKTWADFYDLAKAENVKINTPSECRVSSGNAQ